MHGTHRPILLIPALLATVAFWSAEVAPASTGSNPVRAVAIDSPRDAVLAKVASRPGPRGYEAGYRAGFRQGIRDGRNDCGGLNNNWNSNEASPYTSGWTDGYSEGYFSVCE
jgi:hypothetical protein